jgi:carbonic anhydrase
MDYKNAHSPLNNQTFLTCSEVEKKLYIQTREDEALQSELEANPRTILEHNCPQQFLKGKEPQRFSTSTIEEHILSKPTSRRALLAASALAAIGITGCGASTTEATKAVTPVASAAVNNTSTSNSHLQKLIDGNLRFQRGQVIGSNQMAAQRQATAQIPKPIAIIVCCSDARVPPELIFDQGLGALQVIRTAGHVLDDAALGSVEYVIASWPIPLIVVLGHQRCVTVSTAIQAIDQNHTEPGSIQSLVEYMRPSILKAEGQGITRLTNAIHNNIAHTVDTLSGSKIISNAVNAGKLTIVSSYYDVDTGKVSMLTNQ